MKKSHIKWNVFWLGLGLGALGLRSWLGMHPEWVERFYSRGLFLGIRWTIDYLVAWLPVPLIYFFFALSLWVVIRRFRSWYRAKRSPADRIKLLAARLMGMSGGLVFFFLFLWGFNYARLPIEQQLGLEPRPLTLEELREELELETRKIIHWRSQIGGLGDSALTAEFLPPDLEVRLRGALEGWLAQHHFPVVGRVRARLLYPRGVFLRFSSSGLYFPFTGEGHVDAGVHPLLRPFVMTHEMGHGYGFGDEGTCNFLAYLSCTRSEDPLIAYAGHLSYWRTLAVQYLRRQPERYREFRRKLPAGIIADLDAINANLEKYPDIFPELRYQAYDAYLKSQGIPEGMLNYNRVIMLARAWRTARSI